MPNQISTILAYFNATLSSSCKFTFVNLSNSVFCYKKQVKDLAGWVSEVEDLACAVGEVAELQEEWRHRVDVPNPLYYPAGWRN